MDFITEYFINPIISPELQGYNLVNTITYIVMLVIACGIIYTVLKKKIIFDKRFFLAILPYVLFGISLRVVMHQVELGSVVLDGITKTANPLQFGFWFFTPGIWILTFAVVIIGLLFAKVWKQLDYKRLAAVGIVACIPPLAFNLMHINNGLVFAGTAIIIAIVAYGICYLVNRFSKYKILHDPMNIFIVAGQAIDGIASSIAITFFSFTEQHVLSNVLLNISPLVFIGAKLLIAVLICWSLDDYAKENHKRKNMVGFIKVIISILGFATGLASLFKLGII
ncbi:MAG: DUF63 family protein [archaeon]